MIARAFNFHANKPFIVFVKPAVYPRYIIQSYCLEKGEKSADNY